VPNGESENNMQKYEKGGEDAEEENVRRNPETSSQSPKNVHENESPMKGDEEILPSSLHLEH